MKKLLLLILSLTLMSGIALAATKTNGDIFSTGEDASDTSSVKVRMDSSGNIITDGGVQATGALETDAASILVHETFLNVDLDTDCVVSAHELSSSSFILGGSNGGTTSWYRSDGATISGMTQPKYPRVLTFKMVQDDGEYSSHTVTGVWTVYGDDQFGTARTDAITISTMTYSFETNYAFGFISTMTFAATQFQIGTQTDVDISIGVADEIGLAGNIVSRADVYKVCEDQISYDVDWSSVTVDTTYETIEFWNDPNGTKDWDVWYRKALP